MHTAKKKINHILANTVILTIGLTIGLLYLLAEPLSTTYQFYGGHLDLYLASVPPLEMWTRVVIVIIFSMFSAFAQLLFIRQRHIQHQLQRSEQMAQQSNRLATVGEMASGIAHEINNPLTSILGYSELLLRQDVPDNIRPDLEMIHNSAAKVAQIEKRLLAFSRQQKPERTLVDINQLITTTMELRSYAIRNNNIQVETKLAETLPWIVTDPSQLQQVLVNVVMNAETEMKNANNGGTLRIVSELNDRHACIRISDNGGGIDKANLERIFDPFFTTREVGQGTGLGLSVCHGLMVELGGSISANSQPGQGAEFSISLPVQTEAKQTPQPAQLPKIACGLHSTGESCGD
jgi:signal transduction histidine kinase